MANIAGVRSSSHTGIRARNRAAIARSQKLPHRIREHRQLIDADEQVLAALVLVNVLLSCAVAELRGRSVRPKDGVQRIVEAKAFNVAPQRKYLAAKLRHD